MSAHEFLQHSFEAAVRANRLRLDPLWNLPCSAYNVHARPDDGSRSRLSSAQDRLAHLDERGLLRCPPGSLHVSVGSLFFVREDFAESKEVLWARHADAWLQGLSNLLNQIPPFTLTFQHVVVTDAAVIALAECPRELQVIRQGLATLRSDSGFERSQPTIVHTTLFRFGATLRDPGALLDVCRSILLEASFPVREIVVTREMVYPSLAADDLARFQLEIASA
jgi:hypothetical protein